MIMQTTMSQVVRYVMATVLACLFAVTPAGAFVYKGGGGSSPSHQATIVALDDGTPNAPIAGASVYANGVALGSTDAAGKFILSVPSNGSLTVTVGIDYRAGTLAVSAADEGQTLNVILTGEGSEADLTLTVAQAPNGVLTGSLQQSLTLIAHNQSGAIVGVSSVESLLVYGVAPGSDIVDDYGPDFSSIASVQPNGTIRIVPDGNFQARLSNLSDRVIKLEVGGRLAGPFSFGGTASFIRGQYRLSGKLAAPPSRPGLNVANLNVVAGVLGTDISLTTTADANGNFAFNALPSATIQVGAATASGATGYVANAQVILNSDLAISLPLLGTPDILNGVPPFTVTSAQAARRQTGSTRHVSPGRLTVVRAVDQKCKGAQVSANVSSAAQDATQRTAVQLKVPKGTKSLLLEYVVSSSEYPYYVLSNSKYNDFWSIQVATPNNPAALPPIVRRVNSQISQEPIWHTDGSTGTISQQVDVTADAKDQDINVVLQVSSTNVGDAALDTVVSANLSVISTKRALQAALVSAAPANVVSLPVNAPPYQGLSPAFHRNTFARQLRVSVTGASIKDIDPIKVYLEPTTGASIAAPIVDTGATPGAKIPQGDTSELLTVTATSPNPTYPITLAPSDLFREFQYRISYTDPKDPTCKLEAKSQTIKSLFRAPAWPSNQRTGGRDAGGDDWSSPTMYRWLDARRNTAPALYYNDISGEHGRNIGHQGHMYGLNIDVLQFGKYPGISGGSDNYSKLRANVIVATSGAASTQAAANAKAAVASWIQAQRAGIAQIVSDPSIIQVIVGAGGPEGASGLPANWLKSLLVTGKISTPKALDIGGSLATDKLTFRTDHNDHNHLTIKDNP